MKTYESKIIIALVGLLLYTLTLTLLGPVMSALTSSKTLSSTGTVKAIGVGVYWDQSCTQPVKEINWGTLFPGSKKNVTVFIRNQLQNVIYLMLNTSDWNPQGAFRFMILSWNYRSSALSPNSVLKVDLTLAVNSAISGITNFSFNIIIGETLPKSPDINHDGKVDIRDVSAVSGAFGIRYGQPQYDSNLDINSDGVINIIDVSIVVKNFGKSI